MIKLIFKPQLKFIRNVRYFSNPLPDGVQEVERILFAMKTEDGKTLKDTKVIHSLAVNSGMIDIKLNLT